MTEVTDWWDSKHKSYVCDWWIGLKLWFTVERRQFYYSEPIVVVDDVVVDDVVVDDVDSWIERNAVFVSWDRLLESLPKTPK